MAILFKNNPMPTTGALYVTNPRSSSFPTRDNPKMTRFIFEEVFGRRGDSGKKSSDHKAVRAMIDRGEKPTVDGKVATDAQVAKAKKLHAGVLSRKGEIFDRYVKHRSSATAAYKKVLSDAVGGKKSSTKKSSTKRSSTKASAQRSTAKGITKVITAKNGRKMYYVNGKMVSATVYKASTGSKAPAQRSSTKAQKGATNASKLTVAQKNAVLQIMGRKSVTTQAKFIAAASKNTSLKSLSSSRLADIYKQLKLVNNPKGENDMAIAMRNNPKAKSKKAGQKKGRTMKYQTFTKRLAGCGLTPKQLSTLWNKYKATGKLPALARPQTAKATAQKQRSSGKSSLKTRLGQQIQARRKELGLRPAKLATKSYDTVEKRKAALAKLASGKPAPKKSAKKTSRATSQKKAASSQLTKLGQQIQAKRKELGRKPAKLRSKAYSTVEKREAELAKLSGAKPASKPSRATSQKKTGKKQQSNWTIYQRLRKEMSRNLGPKADRYDDTKANYAADNAAILKMCENTRKSYRTCAKEFIAKKYGHFTAKTSKFKRSSDSARQAMLQYKKDQAAAGNIITMDDARKHVMSSPDYAKYYLNNPRRRNFGGHDMDMLYASHKMRQGFEFDLTQPFGTVKDLLRSAEDFVADLPVVGAVAPYVVPAGMAAVGAAALWGVKYLAQDQLNKIDYIAQINKRAPGTLIGSVTALAIALARRFDLMESDAAGQIAAIAFTLGVGADAYNWMNAKYPSAPSVPVAGIAMGDGGQYFVAPIGQGSAPIKRHMRQLASPASDYAAVVAPLSGAAGVAGAPMGYGALMYTGAGY